MMVSSLCSLRVFAKPFLAGIEVITKKLEYGCYSYPGVYKVRKIPQAKVASPEMFLLIYLKDVAVGSAYI